MSRVNQPVDLESFFPPVLRFYLIIIMLVLHDVSRPGRIFVIVRRGCLEKIISSIFQAAEQCSAGPCVMSGPPAVPPRCYYMIKNYLYVFYSWYRHK